MQAGYSRYKAEAQTVAGRMSARLGSVEAAQNGFRFGGRNSASGVFDDQTDRTIDLLECDRRPSASRGELDGIVDQVANGLEQQIGITRQSDG